MIPVNDLIKKFSQLDKQKQIAVAAGIAAVLLLDVFFVMRWQFVETAFGDTVVLTFDGDGVRLARSVNTNAAAMERPVLSGRAAPAAANA